MVPSQWLPQPVVELCLPAGIAAPQILGRQHDSPLFFEFTTSTNAVAASLGVCRFLHEYYNNSLAAPFPIFYVTFRTGYCQFFFKLSNLPLPCISFLTRSSLLSLLFSRLFDVGSCD